MKKTLLLTLGLVLISCLICFSACDVGIITPEESSTEEPKVPPRPTGPSGHDPTEPTKPTEPIDPPEPPEPDHSEGLEFTSNGDGTCYVSGIGSCKDKIIKIQAGLQV